MAFVKTIRKWRLLTSKIVFNNRWIKLYEEKYSLPDTNKQADFYVIKEPSSCNIVAITKNNEIIVEKQFRPAVGDIVYDFPAGGFEKSDITNFENAKRELLEETGYSTNDWYYTGQVTPLPNRTNLIVHCFLALNINQQSKQKMDETESLTFELLSLSKVEEMFSANIFTCGVCLASYYRAIQLMKKIKI